MSFESDLREIARIPFFAALEFEARRLLAFSAETRILRSREVLFVKGEISDCGYLLLNGSLEIDGQRAIDGTQVLNPPVLIGEMALLTETVRPATLIARTPATVLRISRALFARILKEHPRSAIQTRALIEDRLVAFKQDIAQARARNFLDPTI